MTTVETVRIGPARLNVEPTEGDAYSVKLRLVRNGVPIDLTNAQVVAEFLADDKTTTGFTLTVGDPTLGEVSIGQMIPKRGKYAIRVTEQGANPRTMVKGVIAPIGVL